MAKVNMLSLPERQIMDLYLRLRKYITGSIGLITTLSPVYTAELTNVVPDSSSFNVKLLYRRIPGGILFSVTNFVLAAPTAYSGNGSFECDIYGYVGPPATYVQQGCIRFAYGASRTFGWFSLYVDSVDPVKGTSHVFFNSQPLVTGGYASPNIYTTLNFSFVVMNNLNAFDAAWQQEPV